MNVKTSELEGVALDWAVAVTQGWSLDPYRPVSDGQIVKGEEHTLLQWKRFSTDWSQCGPLIEHFDIVIAPMLTGWCAFLPGSIGCGGTYIDLDSVEAQGVGPTPLIAACRAIVAAKIGEPIDVPEEFL